MGNNMMNMQNQMMGNNMMNMQNMQNQMMGNNMMNMQNQLMMQNMMMNQMNPMNQMNQMAEMLKMNQANMPNSSFVSNNPAPSPSSSSSNQAGLNVVFRVGGQGGQGRPPIMIQCMPNEKVSDLIQRYRTKSGDNDKSKKFIFNAKNLNHELTVGEAGITNNGNIFVVTTQGVKGAN